MTVAPPTAKCKVDCTQSGLLSLCSFGKGLVSVGKEGVLFFVGCRFP
jgi:hypothetical protein